MNGATVHRSLTATVMIKHEHESKYELHIYRESGEPRIWLSDNWQAIYKLINDRINYAIRNPPSTEITYSVFRTKDAKKIKSISIFHNLLTNNINLESKIISQHWQYKETIYYSKFPF